MPLVYTLSLLYSLTIGIALALHGSFLYFRQKSRLIAIMEVLAGIGILFGLTVLHFDGLTIVIPKELATAGPVAVGLVVLSILGALLSIDYMMVRVWPVLSRLVKPVLDSNKSEGDNIVRSRRSVMGLLLGIVGASLLGSTTYLRTGTAQDDTESAESAESTATETDSDFTLQASFEAPGSPTSLAFDGQEYGYLAVFDGGVFRFELSSTSEDFLQFEEVTSDITTPQGIEVINGTLYAVDAGEAGAEKYSREEGFEVLQNSNGKVIAFDVNSDGSLRNQRTIISDLPVVDRDHSPNGITSGPDGRLYLSIGHLGGAKYAELINNGEYQPSSDHHPNIEYLGTIISFNPDGSDINIMARGIRNIYDIAFDEDGNLFGADNDGISLRSQVWPGLYHITEDDDYGYPQYGTFDQEAADKELEDPLWIVDGISPVGIETADKLGYQDGVLVGLIGKVSFIPLARDEHGPFVQQFRSESPVLEVDGFPTIVEADPDGLLYIGSFNSGELSIYQT